MWPVHTFLKILFNSSSNFLINSLILCHHIDQIFSDLSPEVLLVVFPKCERSAKCNECSAAERYQNENRGWGSRKTVQGVT